MARANRTAQLGINFNRTDPLREQLIAEITSLERQREEMKLNQVKVDFSMLQTYKEMIQCRRVMLDTLPRAS